MTENRERDSAGADGEESWPAPPKTNVWADAPDTSEVPVVEPAPAKPTPTLDSDGSISLENVFASVTPVQVIGPTAVSSYRGEPPMARDLRWVWVAALIPGAFLICDLLTVLVWNGLGVIGYSEIQPIFAVHALGIGIVGSMAIAVYFLVWIARAHREILWLTAGQYPTSPVAAVLLHFVPVFNLYWTVNCPYRLAKAVARKLGRQRITSPGFVLMMRLIPAATPPLLLLVLPRSVAGCFVLAILLAMGTLTTVVAVHEIQKGLNRLAGG